MRSMLWVSVVLACSVLALQEGRAVAGISVFPICTYSGDQEHVDVSDGVVVWRHYGEGIYTGDLGEHYTIPVVEHLSLGGNGHDFPAISGSIVVYERNAAGMGQKDIYAYDLDSNTEIAVCTAVGSIQYFPDISGDVAVWVDTRDVGGIYGKNLTDGNEFVVYQTVSGMSAANPAIDGNIVVWDADGDIYGFDLSTQSSFTVCAHSGYQMHPAVSGRTVVWQDDRDGDYAIYGYDLDSNTEFRVFLGQDDQEFPAIDGDIVVWKDEYYGIRGKVLSTGELLNIGGGSAAWYPAISGDLAAWQSHSGNWDIYGAYVPEPATLGLLALGVLSLPRKRRRPARP